MKRFLLISAIALASITATAQIKAKKHEKITPPSPAVQQGQQTIAIDTSKVYHIVLNVKYQFVQSWKGGIQYFTEKISDTNTPINAVKAVNSYFNKTLFDPIDQQVVAQAIAYKKTADSIKAAQPDTTKKAPIKH